MNDANKAVFLSYASQDAEAAKRICESLRAAGVEVWFDQSELVGGDQWDAKIRGQIASCALFVPVISANTQARLEGYFRIEWKLAARRTHAMAAAKAFLLPIVIDDTHDASAHVPDEFRDVQWTRLPTGETPAVFGARVKKLLDGGPSSREAGIGGSGTASQELDPQREKRGPSKWWWALPMFGVMMALALVMKEGRKEPPPAQPSGQTSQASGARGFVAQAWAQLNKPQLARAELEVAEGLAKQATDADPNDAEAWSSSSQVDSWFVFHGLDATAERREAARSKAAKALQLAPNNYEARLAQACYLVRGGGDLVASSDTRAADELLQSLLKERPNEPRTLLALATLQGNAGLPTEARSTYERLAANPDFAVVAWNEIGWADYVAGDYADAEVAAGQSVALQSYWGNLTLQALLAVWWRGDLDLAKSIYDRIPAAVRQEDDGVANICQLLFFRREPDALLRLLDGVPRDWLHSNAYDGPKALWAALAQEQLGRPERAQLQWQTALTQVERRLTEHPDADALLRLKAFVLAALGRGAEGNKILQLARDSASVGSIQSFLRDVATQLRLGHPEVALDSLQHEPRLTAAACRIAPQLEVLSSHPRFQALLARLDADPRASPKAAKVIVAPMVDLKSVAVLAFTNLSDDKANEYFSDGISEELLNVLAKIPGLKVSARTSAFYFKGKEVTIPEIAQKLGVAYVVEGSVRKSGDKVRITAQLIKAADGFQVWSETFTRDLKDIFAVQDEIGGLIAKNLELKIGTSAPALAVNPEAFDLYLQGRQAWNRRTSEGYVRAEELFQRALQLEPNFARAHAGLADVWMLRALEQGKIGNFGQRAAPEILRVVEGIQKALALDPDSCEAHASLGFARWLQWQQAEAERELRRSVALNSNYATGHHWLGGVLAIGSLDECLTEGKRAVDLDPLSHRIIDNYGSSLVLVGRVEEGLAAFERAISLQPGSSQSITNKALALITLGRRDEALVMAKELSGEWRRQVLIAAGIKLEVEAALKGASGWQRFALLTTVGRYDEALAGLNTADVPITGIAQWLMDPDLDPYRSDPRFVKLLAELKLTEAHSRQQAWRAAHPPENSKAGK